MQNGVHAAPGRQVSTWAHAVKAEASARVGGGGVRFPFWPSSPDSLDLRRRPLHPHASLEPGNHEADLCCFYCEARHILYIT
jgi:hypothetical protein